MSFFDQYQDKKAEIERLRLCAFSSTGLNAWICGIPVYHLTAQAWIDLQIKQNGMLSGMPGEEAIRQYLLRVHRKFPLGMIGKALIEFKLWRIWRDEKKAVNLVECIFAHVESAFAEMPESVGNGKSYRSNKIDEIEGIVGAIDEISARYGQHPSIVSRMPLRQIFALQKATRLSTIPDYKILEPKPLRDLKTQYLRSKEDLNNG